MCCLVALRSLVGCLLAPTTTFDPPLHAQYAQTLVTQFEIRMVHSELRAFVSSVSACWEVQHCARLAMHDLRGRHLSPLAGWRRRRPHFRGGKACKAYAQRQSPRAAQRISASGSASSSGRPAQERRPSGIDDAASDASSTSRQRRMQGQQASRESAVSRSREQQSAAPRGGPTRTLDLSALVEKAEKEKNRRASAEKRRKRVERRPSAEPSLEPPMPQRELSVVMSDAASGSPMSTADPAPSQQLPAADHAPLLPDSSEERPPAVRPDDWDSSDEEGAHRPISPPAPEPPPSLPPLPPPAMQLVLAAANLASATLLPAAATSTDDAMRRAPRTTRHSDVRPRERRQSFIAFAKREHNRIQRQREQRERKREREETEQLLYSMLGSPNVSVFDLLMAEYAMDPSNRGDPGSMRAGYLKQLYVDEKDCMRESGARMKADVPRELGVAQLANIADVLSANGEHISRKKRRKGR